MFPAHDTQVCPPIPQVVSLVVRHCPVASQQPEQFEELHGDGSPEQAPTTDTTSSTPAHAIPREVMRQASPAKGVPSSSANVEQQLTLPGDALEPPGVGEWVLRAAGKGHVPGGRLPVAEAMFVQPR